MLPALPPLVLDLALDAVSIVAERKTIEVSDKVMTMIRPDDQQYNRD
jgi:hypothetical protein